MQRVIALALVALVALAVVPLAIAQNDTSKAGYGGESAVQVTLIESEQATLSEQSTLGEQSTQVASQALPLTGAEVGIALAAGCILVLVGLGMRRLARQQS
jgi:hypothetical protein